MIFPRRWLNKLSQEWREWINEALISHTPESFTTKSWFIPTKILVTTFTPKPRRKKPSDVFHCLATEKAVSLTITFRPTARRQHGSQKEYIIASSPPRENAETVSCYDVQLLWMTDKSNANYETARSSCCGALTKDFVNILNATCTMDTITSFLWRRPFVRHVLAIKGRRAGGQRNCFIGKQLLQVCSHVKRRKSISAPSWQPLKVIFLMPEFDACILSPETKLFRSQCALSGFSISTKKGKCGIPSRKLVTWTAKWIP